MKGLPQSHSDKWPVQGKWFLPTLLKGPNHKGVWGGGCGWAESLKPGQCPSPDAGLRSRETEALGRISLECRRERQG